MAVGPTPTSSTPPRKDSPCIRTAGSWWAHDRRPRCPGCGHSATSPRPGSSGTSPTTRPAPSSTTCCTRTTSAPPTTATSRTRRSHPDLVFAKVDTMAQPERAQAFDIQSIPTLAIIGDKVAIFSQPGALPAAALEDLIAQSRKVDTDEVRQQIAEGQKR
ncbi:thioredoxin domain-containing protein [Streptomyces sp. ME18-1-4]|nr:thioredoxin domain-containing protein [Streptomyces sp. ME18-1-4]MDX3246721.1 thioredoxin domain-containing protein [Streptomyces sp. ME18-1-4]